MVEEVVEVFITVAPLGNKGDNGDGEIVAPLLVGVVIVMSFPVDTLLCLLVGVE